MNISKEKSKVSYNNVGNGIFGVVSSSPCNLEVHYTLQTVQARAVVSAASWGDVGKILDLP